MVVVHVDIIKYLTQDDHFSTLEEHLQDVSLAMDFWFGRHEAKTFAIGNSSMWEFSDNRAYLPKHIEHNAVFEQLYKMKKYLQDIIQDKKNARARRVAGVSAKF